MKKTAIKEILDIYKSLLPYGTIKLVAERAGVTTQAVTHFLKGRNNSPRVEKAILSVIADIEDEREKLLKRARLLV